MPYNKAQLTEKTSAIALETDKTLEELNLDCLFNYEIFPSFIMGHLSQWKAENRDMQIGDTIVQLVHCPPLESLSLKLVFGVRISGMINTETSKGFSYETLEGHVENGISTFTVEECSGQLIFKIHTYSRPGHLLSGIFSRIFTLPYQRFAQMQL